MYYPRITVITPVFNASETLKECILSVANQNYPNLEHWFIDGVSTDGSLEMLQRYANEFSSIKYISEKDNGIYDAMNKGIDLSSGEWLYFLGADDVLMPNILNEVFCGEWIGDYDVIYGNVLFKHSGQIYDGEFDKQKMLAYCICHQAIFVKNTVHELHGKFDLKYKISADHVFQMKWFSDDLTRRKYFNHIFCVYNEKGASQGAKDVQFWKDRAILLKKYYGFIISPENDYRLIGKIGLNQLANREIAVGLRNTYTAAVGTKEYLNYTRHTFHYLRKILFHK
jgi:glycosyltransferase involved in cell wall biosynthesis